MKIEVDGVVHEADIDSYNAGKDAVIKGINIVTCNFKNFGTKLKMESWQKGFDDAKAAGGSS